jgi:hypothetical protein
MNKTINSGETYIVNSNNIVLNNSEDSDSETLANSDSSSGSKRAEYNELNNESIVRLLAELFKLEDDLRIYKVSVVLLAIISVLLFTAILYLI